MITHLMGEQGILKCCGIPITDCPEGDALTSLPERRTCTIVLEIAPEGTPMPEHEWTPILRHIEVPPMPRRWRA